MDYIRRAVRIDDDLMLELKERARRESASQTRVLNRLLREGWREALDINGQKFHGVGVAQV